MRYRSNPASCSIMQVSVLQLRNCIHFHLGCVAVPLFGRLWMAVFFGTAWPGGQHPELCKLVKIRNLRSSQNLGHFSVKLHSLQIWWPVSNLEVSPGKISSKSSVSESFGTGQASIVPLKSQGLRPIKSAPSYTHGLHGFPFQMG